MWEHNLTIMFTTKHNTSYKQKLSVLLVGDSKEIFSINASTSLLPKSRLGKVPLAWIVFRPICREKFYFLLSKTNRRQIPRDFQLSKDRR
jgi:hypothetical protein